MKIDGENYIVNAFMCIINVEEVGRDRLEPEKNPANASDHGEIAIRNPEGRLNFLVEFAKG